MPTLLSLPYAEYSFTEEELLVAAVFTDSQVMYIQTQLAMQARNKNNLAYDPNVPESKERYIFEQEYYRGYMEALELLLATSSDFREKQVALLRRQMALQASDGKTDDYDLSNFNNTD